MSLQTQIMQMASELQAQEDAAWDLWTWLPSYQQALAGHGEHAAHEYRPQISDLLREATRYIADGCVPDLDNDYQGRYCCTCGEIHQTVREDARRNALAPVEDIATRQVVAELREHADRVAGGGPSDSNYDPDTLVLMHNAADRLTKAERLLRQLGVELDQSDETA